jgi:predicted Zn-dependent peptidase
MIEYREKYYRPDNATLVLAGDVDEKVLMPLILKYFGAIKSKGPSPRVRTEEPYSEYYRKTNGPNFKTPYIEKRVIGRAATTPNVSIMFHTPPIWHDDAAALYMLGRVMSARTGKMYMDLVNSKMPHATSVGASAQNQMYEGAFRVSATARETQAETTAVPLETIEQELWMYIEDAKTTPADPQLLQRIKNSVEAAYLQSLAGTGIAGTLARMEVAYRWQHIEDEYNQRMAVTAADLMRVAKKYLIRENSVVGLLDREK